MFRRIFLFAIPFLLPLLLCGAVSMDELIDLSREVNRIEDNFFLSLKFPNGNAFYRNTANDISETVRLANRLQAKLSPRQRKAIQCNLGEQTKKILFLHNETKQSMAESYNFNFIKPRFSEYIKKVHRPANRIKSNVPVGIQDINPDDFDVWLAQKMNDNMQRIRRVKGRKDDRQDSDVRKKVAQFYEYINNLRSSIVRISQADKTK